MTVVEIEPHPDDLGTPPLRSRFHDIEATMVDLLKDITNWGSDDAFET